jgi:drug/metabolite transporter (DMT)-like permease
MIQATYTPSRPLSATSIPLPLMVGMFCVLWSSAFSVAKLAIADCPPLILLATRFLVAGALMLGLAAAQRTPWMLSRRDVALFAMLGIANQAVYLGLGYVGLRDISSGLSALIVSANPVVTAVLAVLFLGERMLGLLLGIGGVAYIVGSRLSAGSDYQQGILLTIAALLSLVGGTILFKPFALSFESVGDVVPTWRLLAAFAYLVLLVSAFAYLLWFQILTVSGATAASSYHFLMPPLGMLFGWLLLGEHMAVSDMLGIVPVVLGIYLVTRPAPARA